MELTKILRGFFQRKGTSSAAVTSLRLVTWASDETAATRYIVGVPHEASTCIDWT